MINYLIGLTNGIALMATVWSIYSSIQTRKIIGKLNSGSRR